MDATIGVININQNKQLSRMTVFSVLFMLVQSRRRRSLIEYSLARANPHGPARLEWICDQGPAGLARPLAYGTFIVAMTQLGWVTYVAVRHFENRKVIRAAQAAHGLT